MKCAPGGPFRIVITLPSDDVGTVEMWPLKLWL